ncbi:hypothetical protein OIDMADRAFT_55593 [Oidiodendron maius Zn]|uniref:Uncharacterized protein n=1 Tax=Oidiodendron maius (strain Zn) TaxID=913774 RepID=A0A0C3HBH8_OIDMZ|nr:hypothetical protein OIDMADRAFT_55593 [Oidiodendron maius Zn]
MSTRLNASGARTDDRMIKKETCTAMLDRYLESSPSITEKLALYPPNGSKTSIAGSKMEKKKEIRKTLDSWQESWEKAE